MKNTQNMKKRAFSLIELSIVILIIGILVAGVTQGSRLISQFRLQNARTLTQSSPVASIKDLIIWYEASSEASFSEENQENEVAIDAWIDINPQSPSRINATAATTARPEYIANCINSIPCVRFDGTDDFMAISDNTILNGTDYSVFIVEARGNGDSMNIILGGSTNGSYRNFHAGYLTDTKFRQAHFGDGGNPDITVAGFSSKIPRIHNLLFSQNLVNGNNKSQRIDDGTTSTTGTGVNATTLIDWLGGGIGAYLVNGDSHFFTGDVAEIIIFTRRLRTSEVNDVRSYLSDKYGIPLQD
jgi:prepilin-type N-terminal cleavage/methylation domain-containing protein